MSRFLRSLLATLAAVVAATALLIWQAPVSNAAACTTATSGVTVVVDYKSLGGGVVTACAPGDPGSALAALTSAGFSATRASREFSGYFLCRINGKPAADPCVKASPASAYWSFWHGSAGGSWTYSQVGVAGWDPKPGTAVGFSFGSGAQPGIKPPAISSGGAVKPSPKPTATSTPAPKPSSSASSPAAPRTPSSTSAAKASPNSSAAPIGSSSSRTPTAGSAGTSGPSATNAGSASSGSSGGRASAASGNATTSGVTSGAVRSSAVPGSSAAGSAGSTGPGNTGTAVAAEAPTSTSPSSGNTPVAVGAGVVAVAGLGGAGLLAARRRRG